MDDLFEGGKLLIEITGSRYVKICAIVKGFFDQLIFSSSGIKDKQARISHIPCNLDKLAAIHDWHLEIRNYYRNGALFQYLQCIPSIRTCDHFIISAIRKGEMHEIEHIGIIIHKDKGDHGRTSANGVRFISPFVLLFPFTGFSGTLKHPVGISISN